MSTRAITLNPIARLESHGKIEIFLNLYRGDFEKWIAETLENRELAEDQKFSAQLRDFTDSTESNGPYRFKAKRRGD